MNIPPWFGKPKDDKKNDTRAPRDARNGGPAPRPAPPAGRDEAIRPRPPGPEAPRYRGAVPPGRRPPGGDDGEPRRMWPLRDRRWVWLLVILLVLNWFVVPLLLPEGGTDRVTVPYTTFKEQVQNGNVSEITVRGDLVQGTFRRPVPLPPAAGRERKPAEHFETRLPPFTDENLERLLDQHGVVISAKPPQSARAWWLSILLSFGPALLFFAMFMWLSTRAQQAQRGIFGIGRSRARRYDETASNQARITFADVAGIDEAKSELEEIVDFLKRPEKYQRLGGSIPKGVLLVGSPGTGKTLLAKAVAGEAGVPFFSLSGSEFVEMIVGVGAARVRDLFANAKREAPAIIFIDELDAIGRRRGGIGFGGANQEQEQTLNQILTEMDGFDARQAVIVLAATNRPDVLDPALLRPGRFDRRVVVQRPDRVGREAILRVHTRGVPLAPDVDLADLGAATPGLVGAELRNLVNEAALLAARKDRDAVTKDDFYNAMEKIILGTERKLVMTPEDRKRVAYHESGHALLGLLLPEADPVHKVTIVPRGQALGATYQLPVDDRHNYGERYLRGRITGALGGRAAEELIFDAVSTGAENDLRQATQVARQMVTRWGMSDKVGLIYIARGGDDFLGGEGFMPEMGRETSEELASLVDEETRRIIDECYVTARATLQREHHRLVALAEALLKRESLDEGQILKVTGLAKHPVLLTPAEPLAQTPAVPQPAEAAQAAERRDGHEEHDEGQEGRQRRDRAGGTVRPAALTEADRREADRREVGPVPYNPSYRSSENLLENSAVSTPGGRGAGFQNII
ncbi:MAG: ATP-dependent metallopeptidase FtsH/Yme1/Tma family protein [Chloroflexi bacterium]|nr:ATP-dependent metallopeptidase FtsH/Yme1/Tma family protein [Chloroflexota bacterium]